MPQAKSNESAKRSRRKTRQGIVVSNAMDKSILVKVERTMRHPLYKKTLKRNKKYMAHDQENSGRVGDLVRIMECRPLSRNKKWRLVEIMERAEA